MKHVGDWKLSRLSKSKNRRGKAMHFSGAAKVWIGKFFKLKLKRNTEKAVLRSGRVDQESRL